FHRGGLPEPISYFESEGLKIRGSGLWRTALCPFHEERNPSFRVNVREGGFYCPACGAAGRDILQFQMRKYGLRFLEAAKELDALVEEDGPAPRTRLAQAPIPRPVGPDPEDEHKRAVAARIWQQALGLAGSPAAAYLLGRGCALPPADGDLRFHPNLQLFGFAGPAMVGRISDLLDARRGIGLHLTWLTRDGERWMRGERRYLGKKSDGVVRLYPDEGVTQGLALAEGIESALGAARVFSPVWATMDAGNLAAFPVLPGDVELSIFADRDASGTGQKAAAACAERWRDAGRQVRVLATVRTGTDMADIAAEVSA